MKLHPGLPRQKHYSQEEEDSS